MILLDTNAVIWMVCHHKRARPLLARRSLHVSPASVLELQVLQELGRLRVSLQDLIGDERWRVDDPPALDWFSRAAEESWTRDPFDRLIVAHARLRRWPLATGDGAILGHLRPSERVEL